MLTAGEKKEALDCTEEIIRMTNPDEVRYHEEDIVDSVIKQTTAPVFKSIRDLADHISYILRK